MDREKIALGMVETKGLVGLIEAADAMVMSAPSRRRRTRARPPRSASAN